MSKKTFKILALSLIATLSISALSGCGSEEKSKPEEKSEPKVTSEKAPEPEKKEEKPVSSNTFQKATISKNIDGDTVHVDIDGKIEKLRLIGVDTPEINHPNKPVQYFGKEASSFTAEKLAVGTVVWLQKDVSERDKYDRLLRYVWTKQPSSDDPSVDEIKTGMHNAALVANGYAVPSTYPPDVKYAELFKDLSKDAREQGWGLWGAPAGSANNIPEDQKTAAQKEQPVAVPPPAPAPQAQTNVTSQPAKSGKQNYTADTTQGVIKGNRKSMIYHSPGQQAYNKISVNNVVYFNTAAEAEAAGYRAAKR